MFPNGESSQQIVAIGGNFSLNQHLIEMVNATLPQLPGWYLRPYEALKPEQANLIFWSSSGDQLPQDLPSSQAPLLLFSPSPEIGFIDRALQAGVFNCIDLERLSPTLLKQLITQTHKVDEQRRPLIEHLSDVIWSTDLRLNFTYLSPSFNTLIRQQSGSPQPSLLAYLPPEYRQWLSRAWLEELASIYAQPGKALKNSSVEVPIIASDGELIWTETRLSLLRNPQGKLLGLAGSTRDTNDRKHQLLHLEAERDRALYAGQAKDSFLSAMSHEFKTPLTSLLGFTEVLQEQIIYGNEAKLLQRIHAAGEQLLRLVNSALLAASPEQESNGTLTDLLEPFSIKQLCKRLQQRYQATCDRRGLTLIIQNHLKNQADIFTGDLRRLRLILDYLLDNAIQHTEQGEIEVSFGCCERSTKDSFYFYVKDSGTGIGKEQHEAIFEPFYKIQATSAPIKPGLGLGLYTCKRLVDEMNGHLHLKSTLGEGSCFRVEIPLKPVASLTEPHPANRPVKASAAQTEQRRLLIVDDMEEMQLLLKLYLRPSGHQVEFAANGREAVERHQQNPYDLIVMDMRMPIMNGLEATRLIRLWETDQQRATVPIIGLTADHGRHDDYYQGGCTHLLTKPIEREQLLTIIQQNLSEQSK